MNRLHKEVKLSDNQPTSKKNVLRSIVPVEKNDRNKEPLLNNLEKKQTASDPDSVLVEKTGKQETVQKAVFGDISQSHSTSGQPHVEMRFGSKGAPAFIHREIPVYPMLARRLGKEGNVVLKLFIDFRGNLQKVEVVEGAGFGFTEAALEAVRKSSFKPAYHNGERVAAKAMLPVRFRLE